MDSFNEQRRLFHANQPSPRILKKRYIKSQAVKYLEDIANNAAREKYPMIDPENLAPRKFRDDSSNGLTKCITIFLQLKGWQAERIANMGRLMNTQHTFSDVVGRQRTIGQAKWVKGTGTNGTADISATIKGRSVKIEVKYGADRQSEAQKKYQRTIEMAGGLYYVARTFEGFLNWYNVTFGDEYR